jgi:hypothetical protein
MDSLAPALFDGQVMIVGLTSWSTANFVLEREARLPSLGCGDFQQLLEAQGLPRCPS